jgi:hypothetical protein
MTALNEQVGGNHYKKYPIQPWVFCETNKLTGAQTAVIDYVIRHQDKNGKQDLLKAKHHIDLMIEHYYTDPVTYIVEYCQNCTDINEGIFVRKCECHCHKETKCDAPDKEITDTKRLDFIESNEFKIIYCLNNVMGLYNVYSYKANIDKWGETLRQAIDAAMRGKDGN